eukprot:NODE_289_length_11662_cov_0.555133.p1 type:complete len:1191 gc:universal NODE_289_length_11662_cov_0.555133:4232-7804(+)
MLSQLQHSLKAETPVDLELTENPLYFEPYLKEFIPGIVLPNLNDPEEFLSKNEEFENDKTSELLNRLSYKNQILKDIEPDFKLPLPLLIEYQMQTPSSNYNPPLVLKYNPPLEITEPIRDIESNCILGEHEVQLNNADSKSSIQMDRAVGDESEYIRGSSTAFPFLPGGMESNVNERMNNKVAVDPTQLLTIAPGMSRGLQVDLPQQSILHTTLSKLQDLTIAAEASTPVVEKNSLTEPTDELDDMLHIEPEVVEKKYSYEVLNEDVDLSCYKMAKTWPFELDIFQKQSIHHLEQGHSIFVAAHTSAGKTVVAEYAIAMANRHSTKCIYTSPIKALSNQKYRDFKDVFDSVGIVTGDVQIEPNSNCIIMTTEILRSMLYHGADVLRDIEFVIFDEIHYLNDIERGVCWEEVIVLLPSHVKLIMLSATVPNTVEFCEWVGRTKCKDIYIITTYKRPVPLEFDLFLANSKEMFMIIEPNGTEVLKDNWKKAYNTLNKIGKEKDKDKGSSGGAGKSRSNKEKFNGAIKRTENSETQTLTNLIYKLQKLQLLPSILFCFSRRKCELYSQNITIDLATGQQKSYITKFFNKALLSLNKEDRVLPQISQLLQLLLRGVGCHHSGMLPILKEIVEILFCKGYLHLLFATETFAMGVNAPAKSVVFTNTRKFDGVNFRDLTSSEFIQMSGRSGRRNKDTKGVVVICCIDYMPNVNWLNSMILTSTDKLASQFRITYNMMINLLRVSFLNVFDMMQRSFIENDKLTSLPKLESDLREQLLKLDRYATSEHLESLSTVYNHDIYEYYTALMEYYQCRLQCHHYLYHAKQGVFPIGKVVVTSNGELSVVCNHDRGRIVLFVLKQQSNIHDIFRGDYYVDKFASTIQVQQVTVSGISLIFDHVVKIARFHGSVIIKSLHTALLKRFKLIIQQISKSKLKSQLVQLKDIDYMHSYTQYQQLQNQLLRFKCVQGPDFKSDFSKVHDEMSCKMEIQKLELLINNQSVVHLSEYNARLVILKKLKFISEDNLVLLKGRVMAEINTMDSLLVTELLFDNYFKEMENNEILSILSVLICQDKTNDDPVLPSGLMAYYEIFKAKALELARLQESHKLPIESDRYVKDVLKPGLMEVVYEWANQMPFSKIMDLTSAHEGSIVRCITRLDDACRELKGAAKLMGNIQLMEKMEKCQILIRRDIVFAASLYL